MRGFVITQNTRRFDKKPGTKTVWQQVGEEKKEVTQEFVERVVDSCTFFRRLGGAETLTRNYTCAGYQPVRLVSTSPDKQNRIVREWVYELRGSRRFDKTEQNCKGVGF